MKKYQTKDMSETIGTIGSMLLFLIFAGCMLMIIVVAASTYSRISSNFNKTFGTTASLRYISNKIRASESARVFNDGTGLQLKNNGIIEVIYFQDGGLYEKTVAAGEEVTLSGGDKIFTLSEIKITEDEDRFKITAAYGGERNSTFVRRG